VQQDDGLAGPDVGVGHAQLERSEARMGQRSLTLPELVVIDTHTRSATTASVDTIGSEGSAGWVGTAGASSGA
jgi:hypothetical protein